MKKKILPLVLSSLLLSSSTNSEGDKKPRNKIIFSEPLVIEVGYKLEEYVNSNNSAIQEFKKFAQSSETEDAFLYSEITGFIWDVGYAEEKTRAKINVKEIDRIIKEEGRFSNNKNYWLIHNHPSSECSTDLASAFGSLPSTIDIKTYISNENLRGEVGNWSYLVFEEKSFSKTTFNTPKKGLDDIVLDIYSKEKRIINKSLMERIEYNIERDKVSRIIKDFSDNLYKKTDGKLKIEFFWYDK